MYRESNLKCIETLGKELETFKLEKDGVDGKLAGLLKASKNLDNLIESQRSDKVKDGVGYNVVPPPAADLYLSPKKDLSWAGLLEFVDDTVTDYSRPSPTVASTSAEGQNKNSTTSEDVASPNTLKPFVKFVKPKDSQSERKGYKGRQLGLKIMHIIEAIRLFLAYASFMGFTMYQMDVKSTFLYGTIDEEVYVMQPPGFQDPEEFEALMHEKFQMSAMGELNFFLSLQVLQKEDGIFLSQDKYIGDILKNIGYSDGHPKLGLWYAKEKPFDLVAYSDSDYGSTSQDRKSTTGGSQFLGRRLISWQCKKQTIVATSTTEAEYVAAASCCGQVLWIQNQLLDYG
nr:retrotransposon protein, putative, unclassified [Tanacetum cinerariifolium]